MRGGTLVKSLELSIIIEHSETFVIRTVQKEAFRMEYEWLEAKKPVPKGSSTLFLSLYMDIQDVLRVGRRLKKNKLLQSHKIR